MNSKALFDKLYSYASKNAIQLTTLWRTLKVEKNEFVNGSNRYGNILEKVFADSKCHYV